MRRNQNGFTLMELLLAMAIVAILAVIGIGSYTQAIVKSKDTERKNDLNQIAKAFELYYNDVGSYPTADAEGYINCLTSARLLRCGTKFSYYFNGKSTVYMDKLPADADSQRRYYYKPSTDLNSFALYASLANTEDKDIVVNSSTQEKTNWDSDGANCGSFPCNYKITETGLVRAIY